MRSFDAFATRVMSVSWNLRSSPQDATGSGWSRKSARSTKAPKSTSDRPASWALASVGQSVVAQRRFSVSLRTWRRALAYRAMSAGSTDVSPRVFAGAWIERVASTRLASSNSNGAMKS